MRRHLPPAGIRIVLGSHRLKEHFERRDAQRKAQRAVAIVGIHPIMAGPENQPRGGQNAFMPRAADLENKFCSGVSAGFRGHRSAAKET